MKFQTVILRSKHWRRVPQAANLLITILLIGCGTLAERGLLPEVANRNQPVVRLSSEILLFAKAVNVSSVISQDGHAHLFVKDEKGKLVHIEVKDEHLISQTEFDAIDPNKSVFMDAMEQSDGRLRLLVGDRQYIFQDSNHAPRIINGNHCEKFLPFEGKLFCAFVISGKEAGSPKRKDVTAGWFILLPIAFWSTEQANKLVLAEEVGEQWRIRAVVDSDSNLDANHDFLASIDNLNRLHILYFASRGGGLFGARLRCRRRWWWLCSSRSRMALCKHPHG